MYAYGYLNSFNLSGGGTAPVNTVAPAITGTAEVGQTLTCSSGTWTGTAPITYAYQWKRAGVNIGGATSSTYTLVDADEGESVKCTVTATNGLGSASADSNTVTPTWEADALAFIAAASITDPTQQSALNTFYTTLKNDGIYTKMKAMYLPVTGSASTSKFNMVNPVDSDAAFRLSFFGGWTFTSGGALPNGTNAYAETYIILKTVLSSFNTNHHFGFYSRTQTPSGDGWVMGIGNTAIGDPLHGIAIRRGGTNALIYDFGNLTSGGRVSGTETDARGFYIGSTINATTHKLYKNGVSVLSSTNNPSITTHNNGMAIGAIKPDGGPFLYQNNECAFASIGEGLTDTQANNFYNAVQTLMTSFGINV